MLPIEPEIPNEALTNPQNSRSLTPVTHPFEVHAEIAGTRKSTRRLFRSENRWHAVLVSGSSSDAWSTEARAPMREVPVGTILGARYKVEQKIGHGGMGLVCAARDQVTNARVAVKILARASNQKRNSRRFRREAVLAATIDNPHVVKILDTGELADGRPFLVMEHLEGVTLGEWMRRHGRLTIRQVDGVVEQILRAVEASHGCNVIHRDIKPDNLFLTMEDGEPIIKLIDFGLCRPIQGGERVTDRGETVGTPSFMSPEQVLGYAIDERTDVYLAGLTIYTLLTGACPFDDPNALNMAATLSAVVTDEPLPPSSAYEDLTPAVDDVVMKAISKIPSARYPTIRDLRIAWVAALRG